MGRILIGVVFAIACTTVLDAAGFSTFSALPLIPLFIALAWLDRIPRRELGFTGGQIAHYVLALAHPIVVMSTLAAFAYVAGAADMSAFDAAKAARNVAFLSVATFVMAIITEEGFFRGWLWATLSRRGWPAFATLTLTTAAFVLWHVPFVFFSGEFQFATTDIALFFVNATLLGLTWGLLRLGSGSIIVSSAGHGLWNGLAYVLFGIGSNAGVLGIDDVSIYGPEVGIYGAILNACYAALLAFVFRQRLPISASEPA